MKFDTFVKDYGGAAKVYADGFAYAMVQAVDQGVLTLSHARLIAAMATIWSQSAIDQLPTRWDPSGQFILDAMASARENEAEPDLHPYPVDEAAVRSQVDDILPILSLLGVLDTDQTTRKTPDVGQETGGFNRSIPVEHEATVRAADRHTPWGSASKETPPWANAD